VFNPHFGSATIGDFDVNNDAITIDHSFFANVSAFVAAAQQQATSGPDTIITNGHDTLTLTGVTFAQLQAHQNDFPCDLVEAAWRPALGVPDIGYFGTSNALLYFAVAKIAAGNSEISSPRLLLAENHNTGRAQTAETGTSRFSDDKWCVKHPVSDMINRRGGP